MNILLKKLEKLYNNYYLLRIRKGKGIINDINVGDKGTRIVDWMDGSPMLRQPAEVIEVTESEIKVKFLADIPRTAYFDRGTLQTVKPDKETREWLELCNYKE